MIHVTLGEMDMAQPLPQGGVIDAMQHGWLAELSRDFEIEAQRAKLEELLARNIFSSDHWAARTVVVVAKARSAHDVSFPVTSSKMPGIRRAIEDGMLE
jgi:hypothetical protein